MFRRPGPTKTTRARAAAYATYRKMISKGESKRAGSYKDSERKRKYYRMGNTMNVRRASVSPSLPVAIPVSPAPSRPSSSIPWHRGLATGLGAAIGSRFGGPIGGVIGGTAGTLFSKITGFGDYKVRSNTITMGTDPPVFASDGRGTVVRHREYICDISTPGAAFNIQGFPINAGLNSTFPWLSALAANFEQYCVRGMVFEFKSSSADALNSTNTALGQVIMCTQYNSIAAPFSNKAQMENHEFCTSGKPAQSILHPIECARGETPVSCLYTRNSNIPSTADQRMYDMGVMYIATSGQQAASVIGELWVTYDIELLKPQLVLGGVSVFNNHWQWNSTSSPAVSTITSANGPFGSNTALNPMLPKYGNQSVVLNSGNVIQFPGYTPTTGYPTTGPDICRTGQMFFGAYTFSGGGSAAVGALGMTLGSCFTANNLWNSNANSLFTIPGATTTTVLMSVFSFYRNATIPGAATTMQVTISAGTIPGSPATADLYLVQISDALTLLRSLGVNPNRGLLEPISVTTTTTTSESKDEVKMDQKEDEEEDDEELRRYFARRRARGMTEVLADANTPLSAALTASLPTATTMTTTSTSSTRPMSPPPLPSMKSKAQK